MNQKKPYNNNLQKYRVYYNLTQEALAKKLTMSVQTVRMIEHQKSHPVDYNIKSILECFNVSFNQMFYDTNDD